MKPTEYIKEKNGYKEDEIMWDEGKDQEIDFGDLDEKFVEATPEVSLIQATTNKLLRDYATIKEAFIIDELQKYMDLSNPSEPKWVENVRLRLQEKKDWEIDKLKALADQKAKIQEWLEQLKWVYPTTKEKLLKEFEELKL
jgi:hypothetical protein